MLHQQDIVVYALDASNRRRDNEHLDSGFAGNEVGGLPAVERLHYQNLGTGSLDCLDQSRQVRWRRWYSRLGLHESDDVHSRVVGEIAPAGMPCHHGLATNLSELWLPPALGGTQLRLERAHIRRVDGSVLRVELAEFSLEQSGDAASVRLVQPVMQISERMHISRTAIDIPRGHVEQRNCPRHVDEARRTAPDLWIACGVEQRRHPADLQIQTDECPHVGV